MNRDGKLEVNNGLPELPLYCLIHINMSEGATRGAVISERSANGSYKCVTISDYSNRFFTLDSHCRPISKKFGIGYYWDDEMQTFEESEVKEMIERATVATAQREQKMKDDAAAYAAEKAALPALHPHLKANPQDKAARKANLVAELRQEFPGIYFSVKNDHHSTYTIRWEDGPTEKEVDAVLNQFKSSYFDGMTDSTVNYQNAFADVFGSFSYLFSHRSMSSNIKGMLDSTPTDQTEAFHKTSFPANYVVKMFKQDTGEFIFGEPEVKAKAEGTSGTFTIEHYSEKSFIVKGDTYEIRDTMKSLGGVWLRHIKCWCYSYRKLDDVKSALGIN